LKHYFVILFVVAGILAATTSLALAEAGGAEGESRNAMADSIKYIAAALSVGLSAIATGIAQSRIGAAGMGSIVEKPETIGTVLICLAIPETMVILGFVVAAMIIIL